MSWKLLPGTTYENACEFAAVWIRESGNRAECIHLPGYIVQKLGRIPAPEIAILILNMRDAAYMRHA